MAPQNKKKPTLLDVRPSIIERGGELFGPNGIDETNKKALQERIKDYRSLPDLRKRPS